MGSRKTTFSITRQELPSVLRRIADALERTGTDAHPTGAAPDGETDPLLAAGLEDFRKFKLNAKHAFGQMEVVLKVKTPDAAIADANGSATTSAAAGAHHSARPARTGGRPSYKSLKKRMRSSFRALRQAVQAGVMPPPQASASFLSDSLLMVEYPGYGDEHYAAYRTATEALRVALEAAPQAQPHGDPALLAPPASPVSPASMDGPAEAAPAARTVTPEIRHAVEELYRLMVLCHDRYK
ncbi:GAK system XXXCH domain-containing protein [Nitratidesulfovibrio sp.]|uniref:GAK system XXXCH domain-containing protein n=1 Tax=Nitratidesulfovibrio sp. TaxID=2802297 RepID=UPI00333F7B33